MIRRPMTLFEAVFIAVIGLVLGSIFTFGMRAQNAPIERDACTVVDTELVSCRKLTRNTNDIEIAVNCADGRRFFVDGACLNGELIDMMSQMERNERIRILTRPNSSTILELTAGDAVLLAFDESTRKLSGEADAFGYFGVFMYLAALAGIVNILRIVGVFDTLRVFVAVKKQK